MDYSKQNKKIAVNTIVIYVKMIIVVLVGLITSRYVLMALGASDYGLFNVVGGLIALMSILGIAMHTTTRRYINIEMGKTEGRNVNKIFNVCLVVHIGFAFFLLFIALTAGLWYIFNVLNVEEGKVDDAVLVFLSTTLVSCISLATIPYQGLMMAYEEFKWISIIEILSVILKIPLIILLFFYSGNILLLYAFGICGITMITNSANVAFCYKKYRDLVRLKYYNERNLYREILFFNNFTAIGALAYTARTQGCPIVVNFFFGTIVNGAFAIATQIDNYITQFVNNLNLASIPQVTQSYASGNVDRTMLLVENITRYSIFVMLLVTFTMWIEIDALLSLWLDNPPEGSQIFSKWMLFNLFVRSFAACVDPVIQATGKVKWYQICCSSILLFGLPFSFFLYSIGFPAHSIIIVFLCTDLVYKVVQFVFLKLYVNFSFVRFIKSVYLPVFKVCLFLMIYWMLYLYISPVSIISRLCGIMFTFVFTSIAIFVGGLTANERKLIVNKMNLLFKMF